MDGVSAHTLPFHTSALVSLDAEKAFDIVRGQCLNKVLDRVNLTGNFGSFLDSDSNPSTAVYMAGFRFFVSRKALGKVAFSLHHSI